MKRIFCDTNFLLDLIYREEYSQICSEILLKGKTIGIDFFVSFLSIANFAYITRKEPKEIRFKNIARICNVFKVVPNNSNNLLDAIKLNPSDYEDALQYVTAVVNNCDCIITRNKKDFPFSDLPLYTPTEILEIL